ncbi:MAG: sulfite exporter TauE/SafE family protein [Anaerolineae bacterium]|nr:sulfite exporter TauE/SafE family protein [Anaerolineae bacterium]
MLQDILLFIGVGFIAQMIDGALGMAYGVSSTTFLLGVGVLPAVASACVHTSEIFTTAVSGFSHLQFGNIDKRLFTKLVVPGVLGGIIGAYLLTLEQISAIIKPFVSTYLLVMGIVILWKSFHKSQEREVTRFLVPLGVIGGFFDAMGGGGWGPIVTTTVVARGHNPRTTIGSVNAAEFFVTFVQAIVFIVTIPNLLTQHWPVIVGLLVGGMIAAPLAAFGCKKLSPRALMTVVGLLIVGLSIRTIYLAII